MNRGESGVRTSRASLHQSKCHQPERHLNNVTARQSACRTVNFTNYEIEIELFLVEYQCGVDGLTVFSIVVFELAHVA